MRRNPLLLVWLGTGCAVYFPNYATYVYGDGGACGRDAGEVCTQDHDCCTGVCCGHVCVDSCPGGSGGSSGSSGSGSTASGGSSSGAGTSGRSTSSGGSSGSSSSGSTGSKGSGGSSSTSGGSGTGPVVGQSCTPPPGSATDPCLADGAGLACNENSTYTATVCTLPQELETCVASVGCEAETPALVCTNLTFADGTSAWECVNDCTITSDCPDPDDTCQSKLCYTDFCGPDSLPDGGSINAGGLYAPCNSEGTNDGTCLPFAYGGTTYGVCEANGTLPAGQLGCGNRPPGGGVGTLCTAGDVCVYANADGKSFCSPLCAYNGPTCNGSTTCESLGGLVGDCETSCSTSATCTSPLTCQSGFCLP